MPNIHTISDFGSQRSGGGVPYRSGAQGFQPAQAQPGQGATFLQGSAPGDHWTEGVGPISLIAPRDTGDPSPSMVERCFPWISLYSFTTLISIVDVIMFIVTLIVGGVKYDGAVVKGNPMLGPSSLTLYEMGGKWEPDIKAGHVWRLITPIFLHAGLIHLASNLFFQLRFGYVLELRWSIVRFIVIYFVTGIGASFLSCLGSPGSVSVGASGALFGIIGANLSYLIYNWERIPHNKNEACILTFVVVINFLVGISGNVDNWAHFGGLITGFLIGVSLPKPIYERPHENWYRIGFGIGTGLLFLLFAVLLWK